MLVALDKHGNRVMAENAIKGEKYFCQSCGEEVIPKQGEINIWHFAHMSGSECSDTYTYEPMSETHLMLQRQFPEECLEKVFRSSGETHRADVHQDGVTVEVQCSDIDKFNFEERNDFYRYKICNGNGKLVWIFDASKKDTIKTKNNYYVRWKNPKRVLRFSPKKNPEEKIYDFRNMKNFAIYIYFKDESGQGYIEKVLMANENWTKYVPSYSCTYKVDNTTHLYAPDLVKTGNEKISEFLSKYPNIKKERRVWTFKKPDIRKDRCLKTYDRMSVSDGEECCMLCDHCAVITELSSEKTAVCCTYPDVFPGKILHLDG